VLAASKLTFRLLARRLQSLVADTESLQAISAPSSPPPNPNFSIAMSSAPRGRDLADRRRRQSPIDSTPKSGCILRGVCRVEASSR
jgi:hypothetical protein